MIAAKQTSYHHTSMLLFIYVSTLSKKSLLYILMICFRTYHDEQSSFYGCVRSTTLEFTSITNVILAKQDFVALLSWEHIAELMYQF